MIDVMQRMKKKSTFPRTAPPPLPWQPDRQIKKEADYIQLVPSDRESAVTTNATAVKVAPKAYSEKGLSPPPCTSRIAGQSKALSDKELSKQPSRTPQLQRRMARHRVQTQKARRAKASRLSRTYIA